MAATPTIDQAKLEAFMGQFVQDMGAAATAPLVVIGDKLGLYKAMADGEPVTPARARRAHRLPRALRPRVALPAGRERLRRVRRGGRNVPAPAGAGAGARRRRQPGVHPGRVPAARGDHQGRAAHHRALPHRRGLRLARARPRPVRGHRALLPPRLPRATWSRRGCRRSTASSRSCEAGARVADIGCGHGASTILMAQAFPASTFVGSDYHEGSIEAARRAAERAGVADRVTFEVAGAQGVRRRPVRPRLRLRRAARHGRPGRRRAPRALAARRRRHVAGRRAVRGRRDRGQPQPGRARVLRGLDDALHARLAEPGGRARARRPGRASSG